MLRRRDCGFSVQAAFGTADGRKVEEQSEVSRNSHRSRVGDPLTLDEDQIRPGFQAGKSPEKEGSLTKAEEAGKVRESGQPFYRRGLQKGQIRKGEKEKGGISSGSFCAVGNIARGDSYERFPGRLEDEMFPQLLLNLDGFSGSDVPGMGEVLCFGFLRGFVLGPQNLSL